MADKAELEKYLEAPKKESKEDGGKPGEAGRMQNIRDFEKVVVRHFGPDEMSVVDKYECFEQLVKRIAGK
jgi:hypothetical protein